MKASPQAPSRDGDPAAGPAPAAPATPDVVASAARPGVDEPAFDEPAFDEPAFDEPAFDEPAFDEPAFDEPAFDEPAFDEPGFEEPTFAAPAPEESAPEESAPEEPAAAVPAFVEPVSEPATERAAPAAPGSPPVAPHDEPVSEAPEVPAEPSRRPGPPGSARRSRRDAKAAETAADPSPAPVESADHEAAPDVLKTDQDLARSPSRRLVAASATLGVLVVLAVAGLILSIHHEHQSSSPADSRRAASAAAVQIVTDTTSFDYRNINDWLRRVQADSTDGSTPGAGLKSDYGSKRDSLATVTANTKVVAVGTVVKSAYCGGTCATAQIAGNTASALVYSRSKVTSTSFPAGQTQESRWTVKLIRVNGKWLASYVDDVGVEVTS